MNTRTQQRYKFIVNVVYFGIIIGALYFLFAKCLSLLMPLITSVIVAIMLKKPIAYLSKKTPLKRGPISVFLVLLLLGAGLGFLVFIGFSLISEIKGFMSYIVDRINDLPQLILTIKNWVLDILAKLPVSIGAEVSETVASFFDNLAANGFASIKVNTDSFNWGSVLSTGGDILSSTVGRIPSLVISFVITIISTIFVCSDYERIRDFIFRQMSPENGTKLLHAKKLIFSTMFKMFKAYGLIFLITTIELSIAFSILKLIGVYSSDYLFVMAIIIAVVDIIPVLGTGTVLIPWGVFSLLTGKIGLGIGLLVTYAIILVIRQVLEPKLVSGQIGLPPIVTITSMYIGTKIFGIFGFFILPFFITIINELNNAGIIHLIKRSSDVQAEQPPQKEEEASELTVQKNEVVQS